MRNAEAILQREQIVRQPSPRETWDVVRRAPRYDDLVFLVEQMLDAERERYIEQPASEFNRGKVMALRQMMHFLTTGETP